MYVNASFFVIFFGSSYMGVLLISFDHQTTKGWVATIQRTGIMAQQ